MTAQTDHYARTAGWATFSMFSAGLCAALFVAMGHPVFAGGAVFAFGMGVLHGMEATR